MGRVYLPASRASRKVANLTEIKNLHTPVYGVKEFACLSVRLSFCDKLWPQLSQDMKNEMWKKNSCDFNLLFWLLNKSRITHSKLLQFLHIQFSILKGFISK